ncbi:DegT/DnrJ/EryC1/StrS family aminotransferase [Acholeplasma granularum]|uniref:DegT/DnrJ/EryC1/StrS family aminotransferase n=1 Tax=Acholeplasma granularum TaxID=264635 RepID=UPI0004B05E3A|nr:DegT/DnrJ/EryC1/StrS family aminotransferase [Acholeplasma granularum]
MKEKILLASPHMSKEGYEQEFVNEAFKTNWIAPLGPNVDNFEKELATLVGINHAAALVSGTSAIHLALKAAGVKDGDIVLCQSLTFSASANPIMYERAIPVFIDSDLDSWNMSPIHLEEALIKYPNAKAVIVVHLYGLPAKMDEIVSICKKYNVTLIEDAAESLGTTYKGKYTGTFGDYGIFSFNGNKIITTSGGGMLVSNYEERVQKARFWATQARDKARHYQHSDIGFNYRMSNVVAGIGRGQLKVLNERVLKKREIYFMYKEAFKDIKEIEMMPLNDFGFSNCWLSSMTIKGTITPLDVIVALENENIEARPLWKPMHLQPFYEKFDYIGAAVSEKLFNTGLCLPSDTKMTKDQQQRVIDVIRSLFK